MKRFIIAVLAAAMMLSLSVGLAMPAYAEGSAPVAKNLELETYRNVTVKGRLSAFDPDGGEIAYEITTQPVKGHIELQTDGSFTYTPNTDKKGKDYFGYKATDCEGNVSQEATVIVNIKKQQKSVRYTDMQGNAGEYYAVSLCENGIFTGSELCGEYCFEPDKDVSRGEFLTMCMAVAEKPVISGVVRTGFADDADIVDWMKPYVMTAVLCGVETCAQETLLSPDQPISRTEAAVMMNRALGLNNVSYLTPDEEMGGELAQAWVNLSATGIVSDTGSDRENLTRVEAAEMLTKAMDIIRNRK